MADGVKKINENIMKDNRTINITIPNDNPNGTADRFELGTQKILPNSKGDLYYNGIVNNQKQWLHYNPMVIFNPQSIMTNLIKDLNITTEKINNLAVTTAKINNSAVTTEKINNQNVTTEKIKDYSIINIKLAKDCVTHDKIKNGEVYLQNLAINSVDSDKIVPKSILNNNIADRTIKNIKIEPKTLTSEEIKNNILEESVYKEQSVSTRVLRDRSITSVKIGLKNVLRSNIADKAISSLQIDDGVISTNHINSINASKIIDKTITENKMANNSISSRTLIDGCIQYSKFDSQLKDLSDRAIRVETSQNIKGRLESQTAWVKGSMIICNPNNGASNLHVYGNITADGTVTASKCYNPVFSDLAEAYFPTEKLETGDPVCLSLQGNLRIEKLSEDNADRFLGIVSDQYATVYGATPEELRGGIKVAVTLVGRIKVKIPGIKCRIGEYLHLNNGTIITSHERACAFGRVLENKETTDDYALCQLWP